jgi:hypothetical protein
LQVFHEIGDSIERPQDHIESALVENMDEALAGIHQPDTERVTAFGGRQKMSAPVNARIEPETARAPSGRPAPATVVVRDDNSVIFGPVWIRQLEGKRPRALAV